MKRVLPLCIAAPLLSAPCFADAAPEYANILKGSWATGGSLSLSDVAYTTGDNSQSFGLAVPLQYFVLDRLALGADAIVNYSVSNGAGGSTTSTALLIGPTATYYFWQQERLALYGAVAVVFGINNSNSTFAAAYDLPPFSDNTDLAETEIKLGFDYFFTPSVAAGPAVSYTNQSQIGGSGLYPSQNNYAFSAAFSIFL